jgi:cytochrome P450 PksS
VSVEPTADTIRLLNREFMRDPYPTLRRLQHDAAAVPVHNGGFRMWVITRYEDVRAVLSDPSACRDLVKHRHRVVSQNLVDIERRPKLPRQLRRSVLDRDGDDHRRLRRTVAGFFSPPRLAAFRPKVRQWADELLDQLPTGTTIDLIADFARPLPVRCLAELLGVPEYAHDTFPLWETAILTAPSKEEVEDAGRQLHAFAVEMIELKRKHPAADMFTELVEAHRGGVIENAELISMITLMLIAGLEPTSVISSGVLTLLNHPGELARLLADPSLIGASVDELLRYETPFRMLTPRYIDHPLQLDGVTIPAGELLLLSTGAANRDVSKFDDPDRFDVTRCPKGHLGFSHGQHRCLGAELGRLEVTIALERLLTRFPKTELAVDPAEVAWRPGMFMRRLDSLPVILQ